VRKPSLGFATRFRPTYAQANVGHPSIASEAGTTDGEGTERFVVSRGSVASRFLKPEPQLIQEARSLGTSRLGCGEKVEGKFAALSFSGTLSQINSPRKENQSFTWFELALRKRQSI
jgi:hypothetical protein